MVLNARFFLYLLKPVYNRGKVTDFSDSMMSPFALARFRVLKMRKNENFSMYLMHILSLNICIAAFINI